MVDCVDLCAEVLRRRVRAIGANTGPCADPWSMRIVLPVASQLLRGRLYWSSRTIVSEVDYLDPAHRDGVDDVPS